MRMPSWARLILEPALGAEIVDLMDGPEWFSSPFDHPSGGFAGGLVSSLAERGWRGR